MMIDKGLKTMKCPCGSYASFANCCEPFIQGRTLPATAEQLMRSRYSAYVVVQANYLKKTLAPESQKDFSIASAKKWAEESEWLGLKIISTKKGSASDKTGTVEFVASYKFNGQIIDHHEVSYFRKTEDGQWLFVKGESDNEGGSQESPRVKIETLVRTTPKIGRNDPCSCGSGKKYKSCCLQL